MSTIARRTLLTGGLAAVALAGAGGSARADDNNDEKRHARQPPRGGPRYDNPFTLGIASGDPWPDGMVLWTRLAPRPFAEDGLGGMPAKPVDVSWELAADPAFRNVVRRGTQTALPASAHSVHVEVTGLAPGREYWYRFRAGRYASTVGRTRTAPARSSSGGPLTMAFSSCAFYEKGYFTAYRHMAEQDPGVILQLGDYMYARWNTRTLADYRYRHALHRSDPDLQHAHTVAPWIVVFDDHEVANNWAGDVPEWPQRPGPAWQAQRAAAFQAYYEHMPLRRSCLPGGAHMRLYRRFHWGRLATFHMLDSRQFRDDQACGDGFKNCAAAYDQGRSIIGAAQEKWLLDGFRGDDAYWHILGQQVFFAQRVRYQHGEPEFSMDTWDGYAASRRRVSQGWVDAGVRNAVVLTGDVHSAWANDLKLDYGQPSSPTIGTELVCTSVSSAGDGADGDPWHEPDVRNNPHIRFFNDQRGYVLTRITNDELRADFVVVPYVTRPNAPAHVRATVRVADRKPGAELVYVRPVGGQG